MKRKIIIGIMVVCSLLLVGCENPNDNKNNSNKKIDIKDEKIVKELMDKIEMPLWSNYYEMYYVEELNVEDIPNEAKLLLASSNYRKKNKHATEMSSEDLKKELIKIFGENVSYTDESIEAGSCFGDTMSYQDGLYSFKGGCGGTGPINNYQTLITEAYEKENKIVITEAVVYISYEHWKDKNAEKKYTRIISTKRYGKELAREPSEEKFEIEEYIDQLDEYKFTFIKEKNTYIFKSVVKK